MTARALLADLVTRDIRLSVAGDKLRVNAPKGRLTPELRLTLTHHKAELLPLLRSGECDPRIVDWAADARAVIGQFTDPHVRSELIVFHDKTVAALEHKGGLSPHDAQMQGFGLLLYDILRRGIDVKAATRPLATGKRGESDGSKP